MTYQILGDNELVQDENTGAYSFELDGNTSYESRIVTLGTYVAPKDQSGLIPLKGMGDIEAYSVMSNQYINLTKPESIVGLLDLHGYATRSYTDGLSYELSRGLILPSANKYRKAINKKFDNQGILGIDEDTSYNIQGTPRTPNSVFAQSTKGAANGILGMREAIDAIHEYGGSPVVFVPSMVTFNLVEFETIVQGQIWKDSVSDALFTVMPGLAKKAKDAGVPSGVIPYMVYDRNLLFYSSLGQVKIELSNSAYDPAEHFTGNTGKGSPTSPNQSTGVSYWTNDKIGHRAIAYMDYAYVGGNETAFTNIPELTPTP